MLKVGTVGLRRAIKSFADYFLFYEVRLSKKPLLYISLTIIALIIGVATSFFQNKVWTGPAYLAWITALVIPVGYLRQLYISGKTEALRFQKNSYVSRLVEHARPTDLEVQSGFKRYAYDSGFAGSVTLSRHFNLECMSDPDVDWVLEIEPSHSRINKLYGSIREYADIYVPYGRTSFLAALRKGKGLINESKVAFDTEFPPLEATVRVFETNYFLSLCTSETRLLDAVRLRGNTTSSELDALSRLPHTRCKEGLILPEVTGKVRRFLCIWE